MEEKEVIIKYLMDCNMFAPSLSMLATEIGYKGKMSLYRLSKGEASKHTIDEIWDKIALNFHLTDNDICDIYQTCLLTKSLIEFSSSISYTEENEYRNFIYDLLDGTYHNFSDGFNNDVTPFLIDLKENNPNIYYGMLVLFYIKHLNIDVYAKGFNETLYKFLNNLSEMLASHYPENYMAKEAASNIVSSKILEMSAKNLWGLLYHGTIVMRFYADSNFMNYAMQSNRLFGWGDLSYWIEPGTIYQEGNTLWAIKEVTSNSPFYGFCIVMKFIIGKTTDSFQLIGSYSYHFYVVNETMQAPILQIRDLSSNELMYCYYEYDSDNTCLSISFGEGEENIFMIPETLYLVNRISPTGKDEKVWSRIIDAFDNGQCQELYKQTICSYGKFEECNDMKITNVIIDRFTLSIVVEESSGIFVYSIPVSDYSFFSSVTPSSEITIIYKQDESILYFKWNQLGMSIPMSEFKKEEKK